MTLTRQQQFAARVAAVIPPTELTPEQLATIASQVDISTKVDKVTGKSLVLDTEIAKIHANTLDHSNSLDHAPGSDNQIIPDALADLSEDATHRIVTDTEKSTWNGKQDALVSAINIKTINSTTILGSGDLVVTGADPFLAKLILGANKPTGANTTPVTLGLTFNYIANKKYIIDIYAIVAPTAAATGCGFLLDVSTAVTYVGTFTIHQLAATGTVSGGSSIGDKGATAMGVSSGMAGTGSNFVYGGGLLVTGANAGTAEFFFRSETTAVTTCKANTVIRVMEI